MDKYYRNPDQQSDQPKPAYRPIYQTKIQPIDQAPQPAEPLPEGQQPTEQQEGQLPAEQPPAAQLKTNRSLVKLILLSIITLGIYGIVVMSGISTSINTVAGRYDNKKTMHFCLVLFIFSWLTVGIVPLIWYHRLSNRIGDEMRRRGFPCDFGAKTFWLWGILGSLIIVGPFIYTHQLLKNMNNLCRDYNTRG